MSVFSMMVTGCYPRSESLANATRDHDRQRIDDRCLAEYYQQDHQQLFALQQQFDYVNDGLLTWQDIFRPLVMASDDLCTAGLVRYFNTNTFYRQPMVLTEQPTVQVEKLAAYLTRHTGDMPQLFTLPGPMSFYHMSQGGKRDHHGIVSLLITVCHWLRQQGISMIIFQEPWLAYHGQAIDLEMRTMTQALYQRLTTEVGESISLGVQLSFGDAAPVLSAFSDVPLAYIGIDFYLTQLAEIDIIDWQHKGIGLGCIDGRNSLLEEKAVLGDFILTVEQRLSPRQIYLTNNLELSFLPQPVANQKLGIMADLKRA